MKGKIESKKEVINKVKEEANNVKECFNRFFFYTIGLMPLFVGLIAYKIEFFSLVCLSTIAVVFFLLAVAEIGVNKYHTANRCAGYELHLYRSQHFDDNNFPNGWKKEMSNIGWEEALRAWRIVQSTCYEELFNHGKFFPHYPKKGLKKKRKNKKDNEIWFEPKTLLTEKANYHISGSFGSMLKILYYLAFLSTLPLLFHVFSKSGLLSELFNNNKFSFDLKISEMPCKSIIEFLIWVFLVIYICAKILYIDTKRKNLEYGFLSIHSCAIIWQAVVIAHFRTLKKIKDNELDNIFGYTKFLSEYAVDLAKEKNIYRIHEWIDGK